MKTDKELIDNFTQDKDEKAFTKIIKRHGDMVHRVCSRILGNTHDAEDAAQAVFIILVKKAGSLKRKEALSSWLYGVARNISLKMLHKRLHRTEHEEDYRMSYKTEDPVSCQKIAPEHNTFLRMLDKEMGRLSERQRQAVVLLHLEGHNQKDAARIAGCSQTALSSRAGYGIMKLRKKLAKKGLTLSISAIISLLHMEAEAAASSSILPLIVTASSAALAGTAETTLSVPVMSLVKGGMKMLLWKKIVSFAIPCIAVLTIAGAGTAISAGNSIGNGRDKSADAVKRIVHSAPENNRKHKQASASVADSDKDRELLNITIDICYKRHLLPEILADLERRTPLSFAYAETVDKSVPFSLESKKISIKNVITALAKACRLTWEQHSDYIVFRPSDTSGSIPQLVKKFEQGDVQARCEAVFDLANLSDKRMYPYLFKALRDPEPAVVAWTVRGLASRHLKMLRWVDGTETAVKPLIAILSTAPPGVPLKETALVLGATGRPEAVKALSILLKSNQSKLIQAIAKALALTQTPEAVTAIVDSINRISAKQGRFLIPSLGSINLPAATEALIKLWETKRSSIFRADILKTGFGKKRTDHTLDIMLAQAQSNDPMTRWGALSGLFKAGHPQAVDRIAAQVDHSDMRLRQLAALILETEYLDEKAVETLSYLLKDKGPFIAEFALQSLGRTHQSAAVPVLSRLPMNLFTLQALVKSQDKKAFDAVCALINKYSRKNRSFKSGSSFTSGSKRKAGISAGGGDINNVFSKPDPNIIKRNADAIRALAKSRFPRAIEILTGLAGDGQKEIRTAAHHGLIHIQLERTDQLISLLRSNNTYLQEGAALAAGGDPNDPIDQINDCNLLPVLLQLLESKEQQVRTAVIFGLGHLGMPHAYPELGLLLNDGDPDIRYRTVAALGDIADYRSIRLIAPMLKDPVQNVRWIARSRLKNLKDLYSFDKFNPLTVENKEIF